MAFNYSKTCASFLNVEERGNCWWLHQRFLLSASSSPITGNWKSDTSLSKHFLLLFFLTHSQMKNDQTFINRNWNWLKLTYWWRLIKRTHFSKAQKKRTRCIINESLSYFSTRLRGVYYFGMISLIKHFTVYRFNLKWVIDFRCCTWFLTFLYVPIFFSTAIVAISANWRRNAHVLVDRSLLFA